MKIKRQNWFVDAELQSTILVRAVTYWAAVVLLMLAAPATIQSFLQPQMTLSEHLSVTWRLLWPVLVVLTLILPLAIHDVLKFTNRFVGPVYRLRREFDNYMNLGEISQFTIRKNDFWKELVEGFNHLAAHVQSLEYQLEAAESAVQESAERSATAASVRD